MHVYLHTPLLWFLLLFEEAATTLAQTSTPKTNYKLLNQHIHYVPDQVVHNLTRSLSSSISKSTSLRLFFCMYTYISLTSFYPPLLLLCGKVLCYDQCTSVLNSLPALPLSLLYFLPPCPPKRNDQKTKGKHLSMKHIDDLRDTYGKRVRMKRRTEYKDSNLVGTRQENYQTHREVRDILVWFDPSCAEALEHEIIYEKKNS